MKLVIDVSTMEETEKHEYIYPHLLIFLNGKDITKDYVIVKADESLGIIYHIPNLETGFEQLLRGKVEIKLKPGVANEIKVLFRYIRNYGLLTDDKIPNSGNKRSKSEKVGTEHKEKLQSQKPNSNKKSRSRGTE